MQDDSPRCFYEVTECLGLGCYDPNQYYIRKHYIKRETDTYYRTKCYDIDGDMSSNIIHKRGRGVLYFEDLQDAVDEIIHRINKKKEQTEEVLRSYEDKLKFFEGVGNSSDVRYTYK